MAPKRTVASSNHTTSAPASKRARAAPVNYGELDEDDEQPDPGREDSDHRATLAKATRKKGRQAAQQSTWAIKMFEKIDEDKAEILNSIDQIEQKGLSSLSDHRDSLVDLQKYLAPIFPLPSTSGPTGKSSSAEPAAEDQPPVHLDPTSTSLLASCTSLLSIYTTINTSLASEQTSAFTPGPEGTALPTPASFATSRMNTEKLLLAGYKVAATRIGRSIDPGVDIFPDPTNVDAAEEDGNVRGDMIDRPGRDAWQNRTKRLVVNGRLVTVTNHDNNSPGKENDPPITDIDNGSGRARDIRDVTLGDEERWAATLLGHAAAEGGDETDKEVSGEFAPIATSLKDLEKGVKRMLKHCPRGTEGEEQEF
ncbi:hypothetical protein KVT40_003302 [Elsinoe batatas]|uniref:Uncharacterized protein n=1 Tax=Elsinoe batatas TaxID=2601811 RepID=A0A8K0L590_9PEZI|nr:hypothetical protein KVT40_003302 [Elsinoe batatas]